MKQKILNFLPRAIEYSIYGLVFFMPISTGPTSFFAALAILFFIIKQVMAPDLSVIRANKVFFLIFGAFLVFMALSLLNSGPLIQKSVNALVMKWGKFPLLMWVIMDTFRDRQRIYNAIYVLLASAAIVVLSAFSQKFFHWEFLRGRLLYGDGIVTGPFQNRNSFAAFLTFVIPVAFSFYFWKWEQFVIKQGALVLSLMLVLAFYWTLCRGGWIGLAAGLIIWILLLNNKRFPPRLFGFFLLECVIVGVVLLTALVILFHERGDSGRIILAQGAWKMITEHPFLGKGLGTFMDYCAAYTNNYGTYYAHNCFLQIWAESGIFSLLSFLALTGHAFYRGMNTLLRIPASLGSLLLSGLLAGSTGFLVHAFFDMHLYSVQLGFLFWTLLGLALALNASLEAVDVPRNINAERSVKSL